jgi:hypothetical protein
MKEQEISLLYLITNPNRCKMTHMGKDTSFLSDSPLFSSVISYAQMKISSTSKTCDMSDIGTLAEG